MSDLFISYDRRDLAIAESLAEKLEKSGFSVWIDQAIPGGNAWRQTIATEIKNCQALLVIWTPNSKDSTFVPQEVDEALSLEKLVVPLRIKGFEAGSIPLGLGHLQALLTSDLPGLEATFGKHQIKPATMAAKPSKRAAAITAQVIFNSAMPEITLVDRRQSKEGEQLLKALGAVGKCVRVCAPTKSGKTVLLTQALTTYDPIYIPGGVTHDLQTFFDHLALELDPDVTQTPNEAVIFRKCKEAKRPVVIDDYHRIPTPTRAAIRKRLQSFLDKEISVILVSWTDIDGAELQNDPGLDGRAVPPIELSFWSNSEIGQIAKLGFEKGLNVFPDPFTYHVLTHQSFKSPFLMQQHCLEVAKACGVEERQTEKRRISIDHEKARSIFKGLCEQTRKHFHPLIEGRTERSIALKTGHKTTPSGLILLSIKHMDPIHAMGMPKLVENMRELTSDAGEIDEQFAKSAVHDFMQVLEKSPHKNTAIELSSDRLHIHPFFKRYILWDFAPSKGYGYPKLETG